MTVHSGPDVSEICAALLGSTVDNTFGEQTNVHRVGDKIFALVNIEGRAIATIKAIPDDALALRAEHEFISPGYYMNKKHWITLDLRADIATDELEELIGESHRLVFESLSKRLQREIEASGNPESD